MPLTDEEKAGLTEEEIAAMEEEGEEDPDELKKAEELASEEAAAKAKAEAEAKDKEKTEAEEAEAKQKAEEDAKAKEEAEAEAEKKAAAEKAAETKTDAEKEAAAKAEADAKAKEEEEAKAAEAEADKKAEPKPFTPKFTEVDLTELDKLKTALDEAKKKFDDGEIDYAKLDEIKDAYNEMKWKADFAVESNKNMQEGRWEWEQERFLDDNKDYRDNKTLNAAFVATVNAVIVTDEGKKMSDREVLVKAQEQIEADLLGIKKPEEEEEDEFAYLDKLEGEALQKAIDKLSPEQSQRYKASSETEKKRKAIEAAKKAKGDRSKISADIGGLPAAEENEDVSEFAYLDKLEGEAYQAAIDKLSPEQLRKYEDS
jgi:hypothetical protein